MALCHKSVHSEEDHKGLGCHLGQGHLVHLNCEACVYLHPLLSATATFKNPVNNQCIEHTHLFHLDVRHNMEEKICCYFSVIATLNKCTCLCTNVSRNTEVGLNEGRLFIAFP